MYAIPSHLLTHTRHVHSQQHHVTEGVGERNNIPNEVDNKTLLVGPFSPGFAMRLVALRCNLPFRRPEIMVRNPWRSLP